VEYADNTKLGFVDKNLVYIHKVATPAAASYRINETKTYLLMSCKRRKINFAAQIRRHI